MSRRGYISAGEKILVELQEMQKREEELRCVWFILSYRNKNETKLVLCMYAHAILFPACLNIY
jgi:hypothetical protein